MSDQGSTGGGAPSAPATPTASAPTPANTNGTPPPATPPEPTHKLVIRGQEKEVPLSKLIEMAQKGESADIRARELSAKEREVAAILQELPNDPISVLTQLMGDKSKAAQSTVRALLRDPDMQRMLEDAYVEHLDYQSKSPEQRRKVDAERERDYKAGEYERLAKLEAERQAKAEEAQYHEHFAKHFDASLRAAGVDMDDPDEAEEAWEMMQRSTLRAMQDGVQTTYAEIATKVKARIDRIAAGRVRKQAKDPNAIAELLGKDAIAALNRREVERHKPKAPQPTRTKGNGKRQPEPQEPKEFRSADFFRRIRGG